MAERYIYRVKEVAATPRTGRVADAVAGYAGITSSIPVGGTGGGTGSSYWTLVTKDEEGNDLQEDQYYLISKYAVASEKDVIAYLKKDWTNYFPIAGYDAPGIASFNSDQFLITSDGMVSLKDGSGGSGVNVIDGLTSHSVTDALSANQGRVLNSKFDGYYTKESINAMLSLYSTKQETSTAINNSLRNYYTKQEVDQLISSAGGGFFTLVKTDSDGSPLLEEDWYLKTKYTVTSEKDIIAYVSDNFESILPIAGYDAPGIASFSSDQFLITSDGKVSLKYGSGGSAVNVIDGLTSYSVTDALSANQGRVLNSKFGSYYTKSEADSRFEEKFFTLVKTNSDGSLLLEEDWYLKTKYTVTSEKDIIAYVSDNFESILPIAGYNSLGVAMFSSTDFVVSDSGLVSIKAGTGGGGTVFSPGAGLEMTSSNVLNVIFGSSDNTACMGNDARLSNARPASDVYAWAKAASKPVYTYSEVGAAPANHSHNYLSSITYSVSGSGNAVINVTASGSTVYVTKGDISGGGGDLSNYVTIGTAQSISGEKTFLSNVKVNTSGKIFELTSGSGKWEISMYSNVDYAMFYWFNGAQRFVVYSNGNLWCGGTLSQASDARLKNIIEPLSGVLENISKIPIYRYTRKDGSISRVLIGTTAQELKKVYSEFVYGEEGANAYLSIDYSTAAFSIAVEGLREVKAWMEEKESFFLKKNQEVMRINQEISTACQDIGKLKQLVNLLTMRIDQLESA